MSGKHTYFAGYLALVTSDIEDPCVSEERGWKEGKTRIRGPCGCLIVISVKMVSVGCYDKMGLEPGAEGG